MKRYWYRIYFGSCPVCGADKTYRERVYGRRPRRLQDRYKELPDQETYDYCIG
jgi:hypothetical protein